MKTFTRLSTLSKFTDIVPSTELQIEIVATLIAYVEADDDPTEKMTLLENNFGNGDRNVMGEALQAISAEYGRNLLMHAAALGNERWFLELARETVGRVSVAPVYRIVITVLAVVYLLK